MVDQQANKDGLKEGDKIACRNWKDCKDTAFYLSSLGYGVGVLGFEAIQDNIITILEVPGRDGDH